MASGSAAVEPLAADVTLEVVTTVPDARVFVEGQAVGAAPGRYRLPRGEAPVRIEVRAPGYESASIVVAPSADVSFEPKLVRAPGRGPAATLPAAPKPSTAPTAAATLDPDLAEPSY